EYFAVADGQLVFLGTTETQSVDLNSDKFQNIRAVGLLGNGADSIIGTDARETVVAAAELALANGHKHISMGGGNDYIVSSKGEYTFLGSTLKSSDWYTSTQGNVFYFGAGDGRDTIQGLAHYTGIDDDPDLQKSDQIVLGTFTDVKVSTYSDGTDRVVFSATDSDDLVVYEKSGISNYDKETYWVRRSDINEEGIAKIGYSDTHARGGNTFTYDQEVKYYIGSSGTARDTLVVDGNDFNVGIWLDSRGSYEPDENFQYRFYRGIGVVDATAATNTQVSIAGSVDNNTLIGGGEGTTSYLWGGAGNNSLVGGAGHDFFMYYKESRNLTDGGQGMENANQDTISGYVADVDTIFLGDITLDDINSAAMVARGNNGIGDDAVVLDFNNGGTLTIEDSSQNIKVTTSDGATYVANRSTKQWETA
ncbi:MAG: hypothetical protein IJS69_03235, partial [Selenomonadaceae bacterium]|nr:hypothetical protein [Selenomonadaceae bacterium]